MEPNRLHAIRIVAAVAAALPFSGPLRAAVVDLGTVEQPINLGSGADPGRIFLGPVVVESNHGYGVHSVISEPRPCTHGGLAWDRGLELNMNLASVFGIEVVPDDETQVPRNPVTIRVKDWPVPPYSPYRKEQVLAATLHCLLRAVHATPETPLKVVVDADNEQDARSLGGYSGTYLTAESEEEGGPTPVPGTRLHTDWRGVTSVLFTDGAPAPREPAASPFPALIPFHIDDGTDDRSYDLLPVWPGDTWEGEPRDLLSQPVTLFYDRFDQSRSSGPDVNALTRLDALGQWHWNEAVDGLQLSFRLDKPRGVDGNDVATTFAAFCHALILTTNPGAERPLTVQVRIASKLRAGMKAFVESAEWKAVEAPKDEIILSCQFVWDAETQTLRKGSVPLGTLIGGLDRPWSVDFAVPPPAAAVPDDLPSNDAQP